MSFRFLEQEKELRKQRSITFAKILAQRLVGPAKQTKA